MGIFNNENFIHYSGSVHYCKYFGKLAVLTKVGYFYTLWPNNSSSRHPKEKCLYVSKKSFMRMFTALFIAVPNWNNLYAYLQRDGDTNDIFM